MYTTPMLCIATFLRINEILDDIILYTNTLKSHFYSIALILIIKLSCTIYNIVIMSCSLSNKKTNKR